MDIHIVCWITGLEKESVKGIIQSESILSLVVSPYSSLPSAINSYENDRISCTVYQKWNGSQHSLMKACKFHFHMPPSAASYCMPPSKASKWTLDNPFKVFMIVLSQVQETIYISTELDMKAIFTFWLFSGVIVTGFCWNHFVLVWRLGTWKAVLKVSW